MASFTVNIPNSKIAFFKSLIENLGFTYTQISEEEYEIPEWQKQEVAKRVANYENAPESALEWNEEKKNFDLE